ncbi:hypothetical protein [Actinomadura mexicana]|uniref:Sporulation and spore germination n=1 Tax=Actinomadura mexicana TaxID=134959 RepID=A0A238YE04_9ACTN|nr:hypothetical protein [Actinomadura mexicana]SNR68833.1 hypothetical protein SAMN06265355_105436 [Actinomadura mexicana]
MRRTDRVRAFLAVAVCAALAGCGIRPTGIISAGDQPLAQAHAATITVYLVRGGRLVPVTRPGLPGEPHLAIQQLNVPPTRSELAMGLRTDVHDELDAYSVEDVSSPVGRPAQLVVRPSGEPAGEKTWSRTAKAQIACTAQVIPGIRRVNLWSTVNPTKNRWELLTCDQFADLLD